MVHQYRSFSPEICKLRETGMAPTKRQSIVTVAGAMKAGLGAAMGAALLSTAAFADTGIGVTMNEAKVVKLARPADTIIIGNPAIADASVQDSKTIVLTGKGFGTTNLVVLDTSGSPIIDEQVTVSRHDAYSVRIYRRAEVQTLSCTPYCESAHKNAAEKASEQEMNASQ
jgi:Flp pilus assembly secretin CpaC